MGDPILVLLLLLLLLLLFLCRQLDGGCDGFMTETDWDDVQLHVSVLVLIVKPIYLFI